jgi:predicted ATPase
VPAVRALASLPYGLALDAPVTCFVGENGSGKSTLLEGLAVACGLPAVGGDEVAHDPTLAPARELGRRLKLAWRARATRGFFLRAEDFFNFARRLARMRAELEARAAEVREEYAAADRSAWATTGSRSGRCSARSRDRAALRRRPDARSHGESFLTLFQARLAPRGSTCSTSPRPALSPQRQRRLLRCCATRWTPDRSSCWRRTRRCCWRTRGARLYSFDEAPPRAVEWDALEHVRLTARLPGGAGAVSCATSDDTSEAAPHGVRPAARSLPGPRPRRRRGGGDGALLDRRAAAAAAPWGGPPECYYDGAPQRDCPTPAPGPRPTRRGCGRRRWTRSTRARPARSGRRR